MTDFKNILKLYKNLRPKYKRIFVQTAVFAYAVFLVVDGYQDKRAYLYQNESVLLEMDERGVDNLDCVQKKTFEARKSFVFEEIENIKKALIWQLIFLAVFYGVLLSLARHLQRPFSDAAKAMGLLLNGKAIDADRMLELSMIKGDLGYLGRAVLGLNDYITANKELVEGMKKLGAKELAEQEAKALFEKNQSDRIIQEAEKKLELEQERQRHLNEQTEIFNRNNEQALAGMVKSTEQLEYAADQLISLGQSIGGDCQDAYSDTQTMHMEMDGIIAGYERNLDDARRILEEARSSQNQTTNMASKVEASAKENHALIEKVQGIDRMLDIIAGIAQKTNMLALNATIEAARAGVHGKGFAVVADEVKNLASNVAKAVDDINGQLSDIHGLIEVVEKSSGEVVEQLKTTQVSAEAITTIIERQQSESEAMFTNLRGIHGQMDTVSGRMEKVEGQAERTGKLSEDLMSAASTLQTVSGEMKQNVTHFVKKTMASQANAGTADLDADLDDDDDVDLF